MGKFGNPYGGSKQVWITQTYHGASNTAIDCYGYRYQANLPVYAIADGTIIGTNPNGGSYCYQSVEGSELKVWYVHTHNWLKAGTKVTKGQKICEIAPKSKNGGYAEHLHLGLTPKGTYIMDYFDRSIPFRTKYADIKASWFKSDGTLNWSKFRDLTYMKISNIQVGDKVELSADTRLRVGSGIEYDIKKLIPKGAVGEIIGGHRIADGYEWWDIKFLDNQGWMANPSDRFIKTTKPVTYTDGTLPEPTPVPTPEPPEPPCDCEQLESNIDTLKGQVEGLESKLGDSNTKLLEKEAEVKELMEELKQADEKNDGLVIELTRVRSEKLKWMEEHDKLKKKLEEGQENFIEKIVEWFRNILKGILGDK